MDDPLDRAGGVRYGFCPRPSQRSAPHKVGVRDRDFAHRIGIALQEVSDKHDFRAFRTTDYVRLEFMVN